MLLATLYVKNLTGPRIHELYRVLLDMPGVNYLVPDFLWVEEGRERRGRRKHPADNCVRITVHGDRISRERVEVELPMITGYNIYDLTFHATLQEDSNAKPHSNGPADHPG